MNYDDELERARAKRSRKRENNVGSARTARISGHNGEDTPNLNAEGGSRVARSRAGTAARRRKKKRTALIWKIVVGVIIVALVAVIAVAAGVFGYFNKQLEDSQQKLEFVQAEVINENIPVEVRERMEKGFWTVAVFGVDSRDNSLGKGNQSDVIMIANLNRSTGEIKLVSVFRDTYLNINDKNTYNKINAAYATGGPEAAVKAINKNLDLNITHYATFNWKAVATVINILGGVEIDISPAEFHYINAFITETVKGTGIGSTQLKSAGVHNLDGVQAVAYGRLRLMDSDYARTERQRIVIQKAFEKVKTAKLSTLNDVVGHVFEMSATNIGFNDLAGLVKDVAKYHMGETTGFPAARGEARIKIGSDRLSCVIPQTLESNVISIHNFLYGEENYTPSKTVLDISAKIAQASGLANAAEEIGHVAVDKGYIPKKTTEAPTESKNPNSTDVAADSTSEGATSETNESESVEESGSAAETVESSEALYPGGLTGPGNTSGPGSIRPSETTKPSESGIPGVTKPAESESSGGFGPGNSTKPEETTASSKPGTTTETIPVRPGSTPVTTNPGGSTGSASTEPTTAAPITPGSNTTPGASAPTTTVTKPSVQETTVAKPTPGTQETMAEKPTIGSQGAIADKPTTAPQETTAAKAPSSPADTTLPAGSTTGPAAQATTAAGPGM